MRHLNILTLLTRHAAAAELWADLRIEHDGRRWTYQHRALNSGHVIRCVAVAAYTAARKHRSRLKFDAFRQNAELVDAIPLETLLLAQLP